MSVKPEILQQYGTSEALTTRRNLYQSIVGPSLTEILFDYLNIDNGMNFLDVGCGYGADIQKVTAHYIDITAVGIDASPGLIEDAKLKVPGATFLIADIKNFDLQRKFDRVLVRHVLHLLDDPKAAIANTLRHLRQPGRAVVVVHSSRSQPKYANWLNWFETKTGIGYVSPSDAFTLESSTDVFSDLPVKINSAEIIQTMRLTNPEPYLDYIKTQKRWSKQITTEELNLLLEHVRSEIEKETAQNGYFEDFSINGVITIDLV